MAGTYDLEVRARIGGGTDSTVLIAPVQRGYVAIIKLLLEKGGRCRHQNAHAGNTALEYAVEGGEKEVIAILKQSQMDGKE